MKLNINPSQFFEMIKNQYSLDHVYLLKIIEEGWDVEEMCEGSERFKALHNSLIRKGLVFKVVINSLLFIRIF